ncbi:aspartyl protease family protein [Streptosporangium sp. NPDC006930]|uniref:aspartyl protease family protein n=1 Tax=unclassified Streptosporangium TaxID=2632669 RepID=UPI003442FDDF
MISLPLLLEPDPDDPEFVSLFVEGTIDGRPYRLLLDTGAAQSKLMADEFTSTLKVAGHKRSNGVFGASPTEDLVVLSKLTIGPIEKTDLTVVRSTGKNQQNLVAMDFLGDMTLVIDFDHSEVGFAPGGSLPTRWPLRRSPRGHPFLDVKFPGITGQACWDTGAAVTVVNADFIAENRSLFTLVGTSIGYDSTGASQETPMYRMAAATVGEITLAAHTVAAVPLPQDPMPMDVVLGYPALRQYNWTMDFPLNRWSAAPAS